MQSKLAGSKIESKLKKYSSDSKFKKTHSHTLNKSPTKNVPSFHTGSLRFLKPFSNSPNKFYNVPDFKSKKSVSFGYGTKTNFEKKQFIEPTRYKIHSCFDLKSILRKPGPTFGISRQDFYKGKSNKTSQDLGPGLYNLEKIKKKNSFYMGLKLSRRNDTQAPGPGAYDLRNNQSFELRRNSQQQLRIKAPIMRTQYFQKTPLEPYDNKVPGPGSYDLNISESKITIPKQNNQKPKLPQCPRFRVRQGDAPPPGKYQAFSEFGG